MSEKIIGTLVVLLVGMGILVWWGLQPNQDVQVSMENKIEEPGVEKVSNRRSRKGPRKPPGVVPESIKSAAKELMKNRSKEKVKGNSMEPIEEKPTEQEEKLEEYLELLDTIEDPNVTELTLLGEAAFDANDSASAYDHYLEVIEEHSDDPMAPFALYKFAWVQFNLGDVSAAIDDMALMLEWVDVGETAMDEAMISVASKDLEFFRTKAE